MCPSAMTIPPTSIDRCAPISLSAINPPKTGSRYAIPVYQPYRLAAASFDHPRPGFAPLARAAERWPVMTLLSLIATALALFGAGAAAGYLLK